MIAHFAWAVLTPSILASIGTIGANRVPSSATIPTASATRIADADAIRLDGELNDVAWNTAEPVTAFVQRDPDEGAAPTFQTEARVMYDATALYVAVRAFEREPDKIIGILSRRDSDSPSDWIRVLIDSYHDRRSAYEFAVNPAGVKLDRHWFDDGESEDAGWDAVWDVATRRDDQGWSAEFRIPFSQLRFDHRAVQSFGFAIVRQIGRLNETVTWPLLPKGASGYVSSFGQLTGLSLSRSPRRLEVVPYVVTRAAPEPPAADNPPARRSHLGGSAGADLKFAVTPALTLTTTINPDFGQVEADPAVVNLTAFETFFPERRPFFIEGSGIFQFDIDCDDERCTGLFYSRRIGRAPQGLGDAPDGDAAVTRGQTTILGATKLSGRLGGFSFGALNALTQSEHGTLSAGGARRDELIEPATSYSVVRMRREFQQQSSLGFIVTSTNRQLTDELRSRPAGAYTGGVDWDWRLFGSRYNLKGYWAGSSVRGSEDAIAQLQLSNVHSFQRPNAKRVRFEPGRRRLNGYSGLLSFGKIAGDRIQFSSDASYKSAGFDVNDLGFLARADETSINNWLQLRHDKPSTYVRSVRIEFSQWAAWNVDGDRLFSGGDVNVSTTFTSNWSARAGVSVTGRGFDDRLTRGGPGGLTNPNLAVHGHVESDNRRPVSFRLLASRLGDGFGSWKYDGEAAVIVRPTAALSTTTGISYSRNVDDSQWVARAVHERDHFVFAHLDQKTAAVTARVDYTLSPALSIQMYAQPFVSAGAYSGFKELVDGRAPSYSDRFAPFTFDDDPNFNIKSFRTTNVLRWEYRPGSTIFFVWQQGRDSEAARGDFRPGRDFGATFAAPATNAFAVKLSYWLNP